MRLNIVDKILYHILKRYSRKIYRMGVIDGFNWKE